jgi:hypothetical protein
VDVGGAEDSEAEGGTGDEDGAADVAGVPAAMDEGVDEEAAEEEVSDGGEEPGGGGVEEGVEEVDVKLRGEVAGEPGEEEVEDVVVGAEAEG